MSEPRQLPASFSPVHRLGIGLNVVVSLAALLALVVMLNYLAARHHRRFLWISDAPSELATQSRQVLANLTNDLHVTVLFDRKDPLFNSVAALLKEYAYVNPRISVENVDYLRDPGRAETVITRYQLPKEGADLVVFEANGRTKIVRASEMSDYNLGELFAGEKEVKRIAFRGEPLFTAAIAGLLEAKPPLACFLQGHGEHNPGSQETQQGYSSFARLLQQKNIAVTNLFLASTNQIPADCALLIVAGPSTRLAATEIEKINAYLNQGGRLLALLSFYRSNRQNTGLERMLADWGVAVGDNVVIDPVNTVRPGQDIVVTNLGSHAITRSLVGNGLYLLLPRSVEPRRANTQTADEPRVTPLFAAGPEATTASEFGADGVAAVNQSRDRRGPIPLAVTVEKGSLQGVSADRGSTRVVVIGDSIFLGNNGIGQVANVNLASHSVDWLLDRPSALSGIAPRMLQEYRITLTKAKMAQARVLLLLLLPGGVLAFGGLVWLRRRR